MLKQMKLVVMAITALSILSISGITNAQGSNLRAFYPGYTFSPNQTTAMIGVGVGRASMNAVTGKISSRLANFNRKLGKGNSAVVGGNVLSWGSNPGGVSGGTGKNPMGFWGGVTHSSIADNNTNKFSGQIYSGVAGIDYDVGGRGNLVVGAAFTGDRYVGKSDVSSAADVKVKMTGVGFVPYFSARFAKYLSLSGMVGYQRLAGLSRQDVTVSIAGVNRTGDRVVEQKLNTDRFLSGLNLNGNFIMGAFSLDSRIGIQWMHEWVSIAEATGEGVPTIGGVSDVLDVTGPRSKTNKLGQLVAEVRPGVLVRIDRNSYAKPYMIASYEYDFVRSKIRTAADQENHNNDADGINVGLGMDMFTARGLSVNLEYTEMLARKKENQSTFSGHLRLDF